MAVPFWDGFIPGRVPFFDYPKVDLNPGVDIPKGTANLGNPPRGRQKGDAKRTRGCMAVALAELSFASELLREAGRCGSRMSRSPS